MAIGPVCNISRPISVVLLIVSVGLLVGACDGVATVQRGNVTCGACPAGYYSSPQCAESCDPGSCPEGDDGCVKCPAGSISSGSVANCTLCAPGWISANEGATKCTPCQAGFGTDKGNNSGGIECIACPPGSYNPLAGQPCAQCMAGSYQRLGGQTSCIQCTSGTYATANGSITCTACGVGMYNSNTGSSSETACVVCPKGTYCPHASTSSPWQCPAGYYCEGGLGDPQSCGWDHTSDPGESECRRAVVFWLVIVGSILGGIVVLVVAGLVIQIVRKRNRERKAALTHDSIPQPLPGPVYQGY